MSSGHFDEMATHDAAGLNREISILWHLGFIIETKKQDRLPIFYGNFFNHPYIYAGVVDPISLR